MNQIVMTQINSNTLKYKSNKFKYKSNRIKYKTSQIQSNMKQIQSNKSQITPCAWCYPNMQFAAQRTIRHAWSHSVCPWHKRLIIFQSKKLAGIGPNHAKTGTGEL